MLNGAGQQSQSIFQSLGSTFKDAFSAYSAANLLQDAIYKIGDAGREVIGTVRELNAIEGNKALRFETYDEAWNAVCERREQKKLKILENGKKKLPACLYEAIERWDMREAG